MLTDAQFGILKIASEFGVLLGFPLWQYIAVCRDQRRAREAAQAAAGSAQAGAPAEAAPAPPAGR